MEPWSSSEARESAERLRTHLQTIERLNKESARLAEEARILKRARDILRESAARRARG